jgi:DNA modification methylase
MTEPYYQDELVTLYLGDCLEMTAWLDVDALVTDPPYGLASVYGRENKTIAGDEDTAVRDAVLALWGDKPVAMFGSPRLPDPPGQWDHRLVWDKREPQLGGGPWRYTHESIYVRGEGWRRSQGHHFSIFHVPALNGGWLKSAHPNAKPAALMEALIESIPGSIADPFAGSGSTVLAARNLGRRVVAVEIEERYCELIASRLSQQAFDFAGL